MRSIAARAPLLAAVLITLAHAADQAPNLGPAPATQPADIPIKSVTLFSSGVGYFEHFGTVTGDGSAELKFKTDQINDILKSLVLQDLDGGHVSAVQYASADPVDKTLKSFQVDLSDNPSISDLLNQLRGAKVTISSSGEQYSGTVLGVETRKIPATPPAQPVDASVVNIIEGVNLKSIELSKISDIKLADPKLADDFARALAALAASRDQDKKPVSIKFAGQGDRRIRLGYVVASPVWKTSYRLVLGDEAKKADTTMQGWAIVENQTDNDWKNISLTLVSGRPISFQMDLYQPLYLERPMVQLNLFKNLRPQEYAGGMNENAAAVRGAMRAQRQTLEKDDKTFRFGAAPASSAMAGAGDRDLDGVSTQPMDAASSVQPLASAMKMGELFHFTVNDVSLPRQSSAMIPIVNDKIGCEKVSIYNSRVMPRNALNGAMLDNTTGKHLLQGPVTVYDAGGYAGDAEIDNLPPGQKRMLSYGVDLEMLIDAKPTTTASIVSGKIVKGVLTISRKLVQTVQYDVQSKSDHDKTLIVEHPINPGWSLVDTPDPMEKTDVLYRFKVGVPKGGNQSLKVSEQLVQDQLTQLSGIGDTDLVIWSKQAELPQKVRDALTQAIKLRQALADLNRQVQEKKDALAGITQEQTRLRDNMRTVDKGSQYYNRLMTKLNDQETQIEKLQTDRDDLQTKADTAQKAFEDYVNGLDVE